VLRYKWLEMARTAGLTQKRTPSRYYNGGFVGVPGRLRHVLPVWESLVDAAKAFGYDTTTLASTDRTSPWQAADQDLLNIMVMTTDVPLSTLGPECMDFSPRRLCDVARGELAQTLGKRLYEVCLGGKAAEFV
jgi:hypothetical protein